MVVMRRDRGRLKNYCGEVIGYDLTIHLQFFEKMILKRKIWKSIIRGDGQ